MALVEKTQEWIDAVDRPGVWVLGHLPGLILKSTTALQKNFYVKWDGEELLIGPTQAFSLKDAIAIGASKIHDHSAAPKEHVCLSDMADEWLRRKEDRGDLKPKTIRNYQCLITRYITPKYIGNLAVRAVEYHDVQDWYDEIAQRTPGQGVQCLVVLKAIFNWAERMGFRDRGTSPVFGIETLKRVRHERVLSRTELAILREVLDEWPDQEFADGIRVLLSTGMRRGEAVALDCRHLTYLDGQATARMPTKTGYSTRYFSSVAFDVIKQYIIRRDGSFGKRGKVLPGFTNSAIVTQWGALRKATRLPHFRMHDLRHTFVTVAIEEGLPLAVVGATVGHTNSTTTALYSHLQDDPKLAVAELVGQALTKNKKGPPAGGDIPTDGPERLPRRASSCSNCYPEAAHVLR